MISAHRLRARLARFALAAAALSATFLAGCTTFTAPRGPLACDDGIKAAFRPDANTRVVAVRAIKAGEQLVAVDSAQPIAAARDMCMVKLLVGPGATAETDTAAKSWTEGIGMEIWLPSNWNERIRNYGGGGWVGGGHRFAGQIGSKVPALVNANMGYASGTHDGGQPHYQDPSFLFLSNGQVNAQALRDMSSRSIYEQAVKTEALATLYYGRPARFKYYDGHSQGGRQGMRVAQDWPQFYDGYLIAQNAMHSPKFSLAALWPQVVMKAELGIDATNQEAASAFAKKMEAATAAAARSCGREGLGFIVDPGACRFDPAAVAGVTASEATAIRRIWEGPVVDGKRLWWSLPIGSSYTGQITKANTDQLALVMGDIRWAADAAVISGMPILNKAVQPANRWRELTYATYAQMFDRVDANAITRDYMTDNADLRKLRDLGRKVVMWNGLAEDVIPPQGAEAYVARVAAQVGGEAELRKFLRMYQVPAMAHSSQGRPFAAAGDGAKVPMPQLPGNANQNPTPERDTMFTALVHWVERGVAPGDIVLTSRDGSVSYPVCVFPEKATWNGTGAATQASSYTCR